MIKFNKIQEIERKKKSVRSSVTIYHSCKEEIIATMIKFNKIQEIERRKKSVRSSVTIYHSGSRFNSSWDQGGRVISPRGCKTREVSKDEKWGKSLEKLAVDTVYHEKAYIFQHRDIESSKA